MPKKTGFTLIELLIVIVIIGILATVGLGSFSSSQMKSRDAKRKADLQQISRALELYYNDYGQYPAPAGDVNGNFKGCGPGGITACSWGDINTPFSNSKTIYMIRLPADPAAYHYYYTATAALTSGLYTKYQLYTHLENNQDKSILPVITNPTQCGGTCNFGVSSSNTTP